MKLSVLQCVALTAGLAVGLAVPQAAVMADYTIPIANYSFELDDLADGTSDDSAPSGWSRTVTAGYLDRNAGTFSTVIQPTPDPTDGEQLAFSNDGEFWQLTDALLAANTTYTLTVDVGDRSDVLFGGAQLRLGTGGAFGSNLLTPTVISNTTPVSNWQTWQSTFTTGASPTGLSTPLRVELVTGGIQTLYDNVRLESSTTPMYQVALQNATADFSQTGYVVGATIDGSFGGSNGWAFGGALDASHTGVWETAADLAQSELTFVLHQLYSPDEPLTLRKLRLSVTQDDRSLFADGLANGGDVTANWIELTPTLAVTSNGGTGTIYGDNSILFPNDDPAGGGTNTLYTITATTPFGDITGIRLEVLTDGGYVGYASPTGNAVLTEMVVTATPVTIPEPVTMSLLALGGLGVLIRRRKR